MNPATRELFDAFTRLPEAEQLAFAMEVLRWTTDHELASGEDDEGFEPSADATFLDPISDEHA